MAHQKPGYDDTPVIPGSRFKVHDKERPQPRVVTPGTESTQSAPGQPPADAVILFNGQGLSGWTGLVQGDARWKVEHGYMEVVPGTGDILSRKHLGDCQLHLEWAAPGVVKGESQGRGNSGVFLMARYEIQVLDSFGGPVESHQCGALYGIAAPKENVTKPAGEWQTLDVAFRSAALDDNGRVVPARLSITHNGVLTIDNVEIPRATGGELDRNYLQPGPIMLQGTHGPVTFRNIRVKVR